MPKICLIVENHWRAVMGGAPYQGRVIAECLSARPDLDVYYLARRCIEGGDDPYRVIRIGSDAGIRRRAVFFDAPRLLDTLRRIDPDVIYQRMRQSYTAVAAYYARKNRKRFVFHAASDYDVIPGRFRRHLSLNTPFDWLEAVLGEHGLRRADAIVTQTEQQAALLRDRFGIDAAAVIPNMHPLPDVRGAPTRSDDRITIAWVANFKLVKRPELFVRLAEDFAHDERLRFVMAGRPGHARTYADLHERIRRLPNLDYLGEISHEAVNELLDRSHFLVNTSDVEGFSNTYIQAWMRGTVVLSLTADVDGALASGELGYLTGSYDALRQRLAELSAPDNDLLPLVERARQLAVARYGTGNIDRLLEVLLPGYGRQPAR